MNRMWLVAIMAIGVSGCTGKLENKLEEVAERQEAVSRRLAALERETAELRERAEETPAPAPMSAPAAPSGVATGSPELASALAEHLAGRIHSLVQEAVDSTIDARIASRVGTPEDIEAIFSEVLDDEISAREEAERREQEERRRQQTAEWDQRGIERRASAAGLDDEKKAAVVAARTEMRDRLREQLPPLKEQNAGLEEMLTVVAESREAYENQLVDIMSEEELEAYYEADWWRGRQQRRVDEMVTTLGLSDEQRGEVDEAYTDMRLKMGDGFLLMSEGYVDRNVVRQGGDLLRQGYMDSMRQILTPEQMTTYESTSGRGFGRGRRGFRGP